jgi:hypothetical protein
MARYLLLIHDNEADWDAADEADHRKHDEAHRAFQTEFKDVLVSSEHLHPSAAATTVRENPAGGYLVTDGPYAETKEALGGFYLIDVLDLDTALDVAKHVPFYGVRGEAAVEVRPLY